MQYRVFLVSWIWLGCVAAVLAQPVDRALVISDSGYVDLGDPGDTFDLAPDGGRTFAFWMRHDTTVYHVKLLDKRMKGGNEVPGVQGYTIFVHQFTGTLGFFLTPGERDDYTIRVNGTAGLRPISDGRWHHVAVVQAGAMMRVFVDGHLDFSYAIPIDLADLVSDTPLWIGWNSRDQIHYTGALDELSIWDRALSRAEIRELMYSRPAPGRAGLVAYWPFDEAEPGPVVDASGNGHHGQAYHVRHIAASRPLAPPFRETVWYYGLLGLMGLAGMFGVGWLAAARTRAKNRRLEALIRERTAEIEAQAAQLKELGEAKSRFFANISHEFRTPLTLSLGLLGDVLAARSGPVPAAAHTDLQQVERSNRILLRLVNQLLDVARIEAHQLTLQVHQVDLAALLRLLAGAFAAVAERDAIAFDQHTPQRLLAWLDPEQVELIVTNLLSNAFKYTPSGGRIRLELDADAEAATIRVRDTGPGIDAAHLPHIFDRFYQADDSHQQVGTGIGLAFVKEVVELHGGTVDVESVAGFGTCFTVALPITRTHYENRAQAVLHDTPMALPEAVPAAPSPARAVSDIAPAPPPAAEVGDQKTVLVVDDHAEIRAFVRRHLGETYHIEEAADGAEALEKARAHPPDLVLSDVMMPRLDGFGLVAALRADPELDFVPILLLTARAEPEDRLTGLGLGADDYLTKPFSTEELRLRVHNAIARQKRLRLRLQGGVPAPAPAENGTPPPPHAPTPSGSDFLDRVRTVARQHLGEEGFGVEALADAMAMERTTLYRHLSEAAGVAPTVFLRDLRLDEAAGLLRSGEGTVSEVAYAVGFQSISYFSRRFKERFGISPSRYQAEARLAGEA